MESHLSDIVISLCGRDKGQLLLVVGEEGQFVLVANGKQRRAEQPKRKKLRHLKPCKAVLLDENLATDRMLRCALKAFEAHRDEGGD